MANEFIARKGLIVLNNGAKITGSLEVSSNSIFYGPVTASAGATGSFTGSFKGDGSQLTGLGSDLRISGSTGNDTLSLLTDTLTLSGSNGVTTVVTNNTVTIGIPLGTVSASSQVDHNATTNYVANQHVDHSTVSITAGNGLTGGGDITTTRTLTLDTGSTHFTDGIKKKLNTDGVVSSSAQIDVTQTTNYSTLATTGSNTFTGIQTISNTTNSTNFTDGALIVQGGVGIAKNVNISGSLNVTGLFTVTSMSVQYVTSSQVVVADNEIILNATNATRFGGMSVIDSGSATPLTGSLYWDSYTNRWLAQNISGSSITSGIVILGPENTTTTGNEAQLVDGRVVVATEGNHIDNRPGYSPLRIVGNTLHAEENVYVTGSLTASFFSGDGSNLSGIVTTLIISGSDDTTTTNGYVNLKNEALIVSASEGINLSVSNQTLTISGELANGSNKGVASFDAANFSSSLGHITAYPITFNTVPLNLGSSYSFGLQNITPYGATTTDQLSLQGGAIIQGVLFASASNLDVDTGTEVVATVSTGSYDAAFFDYVIKKTTNYRAGTVMVVWDQTGNVEFTDTSTNDLGNTNDVVLSADILSGNARLKATVNSDNWIVKTAVRAL